MLELGLVGLEFVGLGLGLELGLRSTTFANFQISSTNVE